MDPVAKTDWSHRTEVGEGETAAAAVIRAVTAAEECEPEDLVPVYRTVDTDALNMLFEHARTERPSEVTVEFTYEGYLVQVSGSAVRLSEDTDRAA